MSLIAGGETLGIPAALQLRIIEQWLAFRAELRLTAVGVEVPVVNDEHRAAGTVDRIDLVGRDLMTPFGVLCAGDLVVGDIKTGSLTTYADGTPRYWVKYGPQLALYAGGVPYDVDAEQRGEWEPHPPRQDIALLYHYDLARALDGEPVDWLVIPVDLHAAAAGVVASQAVHDYAKRRDVFGAPLQLAAGRRARLLERYHQLADVDRERFLALGVDRNDLDAVEAALDQVDPFAQVTEPQPRRRAS